MKRMYPPALQHAFVFRVHPGFLSRKLSVFVVVVPSDANSAAAANLCSPVNQSRLVRFLSVEKCEDNFLWIAADSGTQIACPLA